MASSKYTPSTYHATKNEVGVFTTPGYSDDIKPLWRFKNAEEAKKSAESIWERFERYREKDDFVGMDICRKFIQMGRTRSLRYALRPGGRKYDEKTGKENKRTGKVYDQSKLDGANIYESWLDKCWNDEQYKKAWENWKDGKDNANLKEESKSDGKFTTSKSKIATNTATNAKRSRSESDVSDDEYSEEEDEKPKVKLRKTRKTTSTSTPQKYPKSPENGTPKSRKKSKKS
ncbi:uncharacterized protein L201_004917 [Kwoniella dendrophila CBS 6074]|uniref:Cytoplasmic protein n=1 Tax=Kwoniella dendrophila CBS 6074 TaxID=1295534 RepID=A0AAX4JX70_9TREE